MPTPSRAQAIQIELLVLEAQSGDARAMTRLYERYQGVLTRRAIVLTNNTDAAADITQDTWVAIARSIRKLRDPARFQAWAFSILSNTARDWIKAQIKQRQAHANQPRPSERQAPAPSDPSPTDPGAVRLAIMALPPKLRDVVILIYMDRCTIEQAAAALAIPTGTAKSRLRKARDQLRATIEPQTQPRDSERNPKWTTSTNRSATP